MHRELTTWWKVSSIPDLIFFLTKFSPSPWNMLHYLSKNALQKLFHDDFNVHPNIPVVKEYIFTLTVLSSILYERSTTDSTFFPLSLPFSALF